MQGGGFSRQDMEVAAGGRTRFPHFFGCLAERADKPERRRGRAAPGAVPDVSHGQVRAGPDGGVGAGKKRGCQLAVAARGGGPLEGPWPAGTLLIRLDGAVVPVSTRQLWPEHPFFRRLSARLPRSRARITGGRAVA